MEFNEELKNEITKNLIDNISSLLNASLLNTNVTRSTLVNSKGEVKQRITIEYE